MYVGTRFHVLPPASAMADVLSQPCFHHAALPSTLTCQSEDDPVSQQTVIVCPILLKKEHTQKCPPARPRFLRGGSVHQHRSSHHVVPNRLERKRTQPIRRCHPIPPMSERRSRQVMHKTVKNLQTLSSCCKSSRQGHRRGQRKRPRPHTPLVIFVSDSYLLTIRTILRLSKLCKVTA
jgi:hypothetical protein